mgnify:CR=1 FL=1
MVIIELQAMIINCCVIDTFNPNDDTFNYVSGSLDFSNYNGHLNINATVPSVIKSATVYAEYTNSVTFELRDDNGLILESSTQTVYPGMQRLNFDFLIPVGTNFQLGINGGNSGLYRSNAGNGNSLLYQ